MGQGLIARRSHEGIRHGPTGWIGSAVVPELLAAGHQVTGLARSDRSAEALAATGAAVVRGGLSDLDTLRKEATTADAVIHLAFNHDFGDFDAAAVEERSVLEAFGDGLAGSGSALIIASGTPAIPGKIATEADGAPADSPVGARATNADAVVALADRGVRSAVVRLPRSVHGEGDAHGFIARLAEAARTAGHSGYVGDGKQRWPAVHVRDAARLFRLAAEQAPAGSVLHAVSDEGVHTLDIATALGDRVGVPAEPVAPEELGFLGGLLSVDQPAGRAATTALLGWEPVEQGLIADITAG